MEYMITKYGAEWCHGCKVMDKIMVKVMENLQAKDVKVTYLKVDIDALDTEERDSVTSKFGKSIPILTIQDSSGNVTAVQVGAKSISATQQFVESHLPVA